MTSMHFQLFSRQRIISFASLLLSGIFFLQSCGDSEIPKLEVPGSGVRLKHLVTKSQVTEALAEHMSGYEIQGEGNFTNTGKYPAIPHIYHYTVSFKQDLNESAYAWRSINAQAGSGKKTKEELLDMFPNMQEVSDERLGKAPYDNVFALTYKDNAKGDWRYELYMRLAHINNQDNQVISLSGNYGPTSHPDHEAIAPEPMDSRAAVSAMLTLVETISK